MEFFTKNNNLLKRSSGQSFIHWATENKQFIETRLINEAIVFLNDHGEKLRTPVSSLIADNHWHYLDKPTKKQSYRARMDYNSDGIACLTLTYHTFRHGGYSERFDSKAVLKALWQEAKGRLFSLPIKTAIKPQMMPVIPEINPIDWILRDKESWQLMTDTGTSHYLKRKKLSEHFIPGIKYANHHIAVAIVDTHNTFLGLQRIFDDGQKRFTKGLSKKGHFALIGTHLMPKKLPTIHLCEGVATAATLFLTTGEPVFSALDAFNLLPVSRLLKRHYPKTPITIWADNDWQKADKKNPQGRLIGNTGLIQANRAAFKLRNATVCTPDFSGIEPDRARHATDFNDLYQLDSLAAVFKTIPQKPNMALALWHELIQTNKRAHGVVTPSQFTSGKKITYNSRYLPHDLFANEGIHLVRSAIGTGKTAVVEALVKRCPKTSVLFTTHLISLVENAASRLSLTSYNDCDNVDLQMEHRLAICLNSLGKLTAEGALRHYEVVVIDEIEQVLARLTSPMDQKPLVFSVLQHLMSHAKRLICLDAHLSSATIAMIQRFCPHTPVTIHFNQFKPGCARKMVCHDSPESVQLTAIQALDHDQRVYLAFNAKKEAFKTYSAFQKAFPEKRGLYIASDNAGEAENQAFFHNVNETSKRYDYVVCTPSVSTGLSIDNGHFDFVGGVFQSCVNTANDCMQALGRIRNHRLVHVWCDKRQAAKSLDPAVIASKWLKTHPHDMSLMTLNYQGQRIILNPDYEQLLLLVTQTRHRSINDFYQQFALLALQEGITLTYMDTRLDVTTQRQVRNFKNACINEEATRISQAPLPATIAQLRALVQKPRKTMAETRTHKKQQLMDFYNLSERDDEAMTTLAAMDKNGRFRQQVLALELALGDTSLAQQRFVEQFNGSAYFAADLSHFSTLQWLYQKILDTLHVTTTSKTLTVGTYQYTKDTILNSGFITWIETHRVILQGLISLPSTQWLHQNPIRFLSKLLAYLGLKQKRVGKSAHAHYQLDSKRVNLLNTLMTRRTTRLAGLLGPLEIISENLKKPVIPNFFIETVNKIKQFFIVDKLAYT